MDRSPDLAGVAVRGVVHPVRPLDRDEPIMVAGHTGMVGSAIQRLLVREGFTDVLGVSSETVDLRRRDDVFEWFRRVRPRTVVMAAARVGGILANDTSPVEFLSDNLQIQVNTMDAALHHGVERVLFLGSSCVYPREAPQPITEDALLTGLLEPTNDAYAIAKIAGMISVRSVRRQYGLPWISAMPTNLYGPGDNFAAESSHVLAAFIRRFTDAVSKGETAVTNWGTGTPRREFLHVDDLASACLFLLDRYDGDSHVNVGVGVDMSIAALAQKVATVAGYTGSIHWDETKPDGMMRKVLDVSVLRSMGWSPGISLDSGLSSTVDWYRRVGPAHHR
ncbi:GDP-L-fucose synthase [Rhodococcus sp. BP-349]|uniref:GDP-L-fucose synthase family protein n=1 Tax=unclassified Rhodococcus (in: high G+C Gram-positive bacteria) TaxID=192944 RepID=UPI001C9A895F|nr:MULTISPECIES: GDP-L-fucose synthase [unclassified Rhodococcus (in: high G+C Gram-positive bacteria)]MBY6539476.1 GDP-L-fucose synthase [Rhodococcus sp. BP-363]MBY6544196.1 GDP-L-fucose synthase [Rhodococcus sp. BP-369]MBY6563426.1 GDP-L-fucose synthase [Rhodococcus sp. BP-370]MBY6577718.1 GDP-L-fucose synthase [Rhodococcus sp. BP-364]MBY6587019.1 GDP-L-fucose synthase [Rhodococcus sp. BP-358]